MYLAERGLNFSVDSLINAGADVNVYNNTGQTALIKASGNGHVKSMNSIVVAGADVNESDHSDGTAIMYAATKGHDNCVQLLQKYGADVNAADTKGRTPLITGRRLRPGNMCELSDTSRSRCECRHIPLYDTFDTSCSVRQQKMLTGFD